MAKRQMTRRQRKDNRPSRHFIRFRCVQCCFEDVAGGCYCFGEVMMVLERQRVCCVASSFQPLITSA